jgi:hypothetical protein
MCQEVTKHTPASRKVSADKQLALSMENTVRLRQMVDDYISGAPEIPERMHQATAEIRSRIDAAVDPLLSLGTDKPISNEEAFAAFNKLRGVLHGCAVKGGAPQSEEEKLAKSLMVDYRKHAQDFAEAGLEVFSVPTRRTSTGAHFQLSQEITDQAKYARTDAREGSFGFSRFLISKLQADSTPWNPVNFVTALFKLNDLDHGWTKRSYAPELCELVVRRLHTISNRELFDGRAIANLAKIAPGLLEAVTRIEPRSPQLEKMLFNSLSKAVEYLEDKPDERFADGSFLLPMRDISSRFLTPEGAGALCAYVAKLNHLFSQMSYRNHLPTVAATFHAIHGISSWALTPDSETKLTVMLSNLNDRLSRNTANFDQIAAASIVYGLKGIDLPNLSQDAQLEVCRTIRLVAEGVERMPLGTKLNHGAISSIIHGLTVALCVKEGAVASATKRLVSAVEARVPFDADRIDQLGMIAGALVTLWPHAQDHPTLRQSLLQAIEEPSGHPLTFTRSNDKDMIAWQTLQQAYSLFSRTMPQQLRDFVTSIKPSVESFRRPSLSEQRVRGYLAEYPKLSLLAVPYIDGFEVDLMIRKGPKLVDLEVDGGFHNEPAKRIADAQRDLFLRQKLKDITFDIVRVPSNCTKSELFAELDRVFTNPDDASHKPIDVTVSR